MKIFLYLLFFTSFNGYAQSSNLESDKGTVMPEIVLQTIDQYFGDTTDKNIKITTLLGGHSCVNFCIELDGKRFVLRFNEKASSSRFQCELFAMEHAAKVGISPTVLQSFPDNKMVLIEYIDGNTVTIEQANESENCIKIAKALGKAHTIPKNPYHGRPRNEIMEGFYETLLNYPEMRKETTQAIQLVREGHRKVQGLPSSYSVNTHNDLNPGNIFLTDKGALFIDWEGTNWEDPFYDLSYFAIFHDYSDGMELVLIKNYLERDPSVEELMRYKLTKMINFARIATSCYYIAAHAKQHEFDNASTLESWGYYVRALANKSYDGLSTSQFFYNLARTSLQQAISLKNE